MKYQDRCYNIGWESSRGRGAHGMNVGARGELKFLSWVLGWRDEGSKGSVRG